MLECITTVDTGQAFFFVGFFVVVLGIGVMAALHAWLGISILEERQNI